MPASARTIRHIVMRGNQKFRHFRVLQNEGIHEGFTSRLLGAGCVWVDYLDDASLPPIRTPRPGDAALRFVTGRRPVLEWTAAAMAAQEPRVTIRPATLTLYNVL